MDQLRQDLEVGAADLLPPARAAAAVGDTVGDTVDYVELPGGGHMDFVDPGTEAHAVLVRWLAAHGT